MDILAIAIQIVIIVVSIVLAVNIVLLKRRQRNMMKNVGTLPARKMNEFLKEQIEITKKKIYIYRFFILIAMIVLATISVFNEKNNIIFITSLIIGILIAPKKLY